MAKTALITGASSGIGKELACIHAEKGGDLILVARRADKLAELKTTLEQKQGVTVTTITQDLSEPTAPLALFEQVQAAGIQVDYLINNAGFGLRGTFHELDWARQQQMINLNMVALTELMYLFLPEMLARNSGKILNTSSTAAFLPGPLQAVYYATKAYVTYLGNAIAEELHNTDVTVTTLMPGATESEFAKTSGMDKTDLFNKTATARSVAEDGYNGMMQGDLDVVSGLPFGMETALRFAPFMKKTMLKQIYKAQKV